MRDYAEIAHNLRCCGVGVPCDDCTYQDDIVKCGSLEGQAANAIEELLAESADLVGQVKRSQEEIRKLDKLLAAVPKWNPASKPPKENGRYYVAYEDSVSFLDYFNGKWFFPPRNGIVVEETKESILYWQPFPAPPKEDAE